MRTFAEVFRFEVAYRFRQRTTWLYFAAMAAATWLLLIDLMIGEAQGTAAVHANAPATIAMVTSIATMLMLVAAAGIFGDAAARDFEAGMDPLVFTSPLSIHAYRGGRFAAAFTVNALLLFVAGAGLMLVETRRGGSPELFGAFRPVAYVQPFLVLALPTAFAAGAILFGLAALTRRTLASYAGAVFLFFGSTIATRFLGALADPFGLAALDEVTRLWTPFETNTRLVPLTGELLWNRVLWTAAGAAALALVHWRRTETPSVRKGRRRREEEDRGDAGPLVAPDVPRTFTFATRVRQTLDFARRAIADVFLTRWVVAGLALLLTLIVRAGWRSAGMVLDTPAWPVTYLVASDVLGDAGAVLVLLSALMTGELIWRERDTGMAPLVGVTPVPAWVPLTGKFLAICSALAIVQAALMGGGMFLQWLEGWYDFEPLLYVKILFGLQLPEYVLWVALATSIHVLVRHKYVGHFVFVLCWMLFRMGRNALGLEHNLLAYGADPGWSYSDLSGFEPFLLPWLSFTSYWAAWAVLLVAAALQARRPFTRRGALAMAGAVAGVLVSGGWVFWNTNVLNEYQTQRERDDIRAEYERRYKRYETLPQPLVTHVRLEVELHPERRAAEIRGTYRLENQSTSAIDTVHVLLDEDVEQRALLVDGARLAARDARHRYDVFRLDRPLQPGHSLALRFHLTHARRGFPNARASGEVVGNGTYVDRTRLPMIGYQPVRELTGEDERKARGLPPRRRLAPLDDATGRRYSAVIRDSRWLQLETIVGTSADQIAVAPGSLRRTWTVAGRRYFHYATDAPIQNIYAIHSAAYAVRRERRNGVLLEVLHHPGHTRNVGRILAGMKASLDYHTRHFGPYPHRVLRVVEFPRHRGSYARAYPTSIAFSESFGFLARPENGVDYPFLVAAHEVAHQWWGNQLRAAQVEGNQVLTETLAHYGAMAAMEKTYGREPLDRLRPLLLRQYLVGRRSHASPEVPLLRSDDQAYIHYDKGALVMTELRNALGEERVNAALRRLLEKYRFSGPPYATTRDLYAELHAAAPAPLRPYLHDLFAKIVLWDVRATDARVERQRTGAYRVTFTVTAEKLEADGAGRDRAIPMDEWVEAGVFAGPAADGTPGRPLYLGRHRIRSGRQTITVRVAEAPARAGIDPYRRLIERELTFDGRTDNLSEVGD